MDIRNIISPEIIGTFIGIGYSFIAIAEAEHSILYLVVNALVLCLIATGIFALLDKLNEYLSIGGGHIKSFQKQFATGSNYFMASTMIGSCVFSIILDAFRILSGPQ